jgi:hypothetical protein
MDIQTDGHTNRCTYRQMDAQRDLHTDGLIDDGHTDIQTYKQNREY